MNQSPTSYQWERTAVPIEGSTILVTKWTKNLNKPISYPDEPSTPVVIQDENKNSDTQEDNYVIVEPPSSPSIMEQPSAVPDSKMDAEDDTNPAQADHEMEDALPQNEDLVATTAAAKVLDIHHNTTSAPPTNEDASLPTKEHAPAQMDSSTVSDIDPAQSLITKESDAVDLLMMMATLANERRPV